MAPTFVAALGGLGELVAARLDARPPSATFAVVRVPTHEVADRPQVIAEFTDRTAAALDKLLRAGATRATLDGGGRGKLDLILLADVIEAGASLLRDIAQAMSQVMAERYAVMFPPDTAAQQRTVGMVVVLATPALDRSPRAAAALRAVQGLEAWHTGGPPSPILNRIYLLPRQNAVMPLSDDDVERAAYLFVSATHSPLLREIDAIRERLAPPRDPARMVDSFAVAAADVEVERIADAFAWSSALAGLGTLCDQMQRPAPRHGSEVDVNGWLRAADDDLRAGGEKADGAEYDALQSFERDLHQLVDERIGGDDGLLRYREVRDSLEQTAARLGELARADPDWLPPAATPAPVTAASTRPAPAAADDDRPPATAETTALAGLGLAAAVAVTTAALFAVASVRSAAGAADPGIKVTSAAAPVGADPLMAIVWGVIAGIAIGLGWAFASRWAGKRRHGEKDAVDKQQRTVEAAAAPTGDLRGGALRRRRLARAALAVVEDEAERLNALRAAIIEARDRAGERLRAMGVTIGETSDGDDYGRLFGAETPLHVHLLPASVLPRLWARTRAVREDELWAARLLRAAYPRGGHRDDLPFADGGAWEQALRQQHAALADDSVFAWPDVQPELTREQVRLFLAGAPRSLELGVRPRNPDGTPATLSSSRDLLLVVPQTGRAVVDRALSEQPIADARLYPGDDRLARVVILRTAGEIDSARLA